MKSSRTVEILILGLWILIAVVVFWKHKFPRKEMQVPDQLQYQDISQVQAGKEFDLRKITVLQAGGFDLTLKDDNSSRILAELDVRPTTEARDRLVDLFNHASKPMVKLKKKQENGRWSVDLFVVHDSAKINIADWLADKKLIYK